MRKRVMGFLAGALFVSRWIRCLGFTANAGIKALADKPASMRRAFFRRKELAGMMGDQFGIDDGSIKLDAKPGKEQPGRRSGGSDGRQFKSLPLTRTVNDVEVTIHSIRVTEQNTDFEVTIKNNSDLESVTLRLDEVKAEANSGVKGSQWKA